LTEAFTTGPQNPMQNSHSKPPLCMDYHQVHLLTFLKDLGLKLAPGYSFLHHDKYGAQVDKSQEDSSLPKLVRFEILSKSSSGIDGPLN